MLARLFDSPWSIVVIVVVIVLLFGWKRLPDAARSLGRSMRIFKSEVQEMTGDKDEPSAASTDTVRGETTTRQTGTESATNDGQPASSEAANGDEQHRA